MLWSKCHIIQLQKASESDNRKQCELSFLLSNSANVRSQESEVHVASKWLLNLVIEMQPSIRFISLFFILIYILLHWNIVIGSWKWSFLYIKCSSSLSSLSLNDVQVQTQCRPGQALRWGHGCGSSSVFNFLPVLVSGKQTPAHVPRGGIWGWREEVGYNKPSTAGSWIP